MNPATVSSSPLVSVGIPTYNRCGYLKEVVEAILTQSYRNLEIIISDDCSSDETEGYCQAMAREDPRLIYIRQSTNIGSEKNFEYVFQRATGDFFMWHADDDLCEPDYISKLLAHFSEDNSVVLCCSDVKIVDANGVFLRTTKLKEIYPSNDWENARKSFFLFPKSYPKNSATHFAIYGIFRASALRECGLSLSGWKGILTTWETAFLARLSTIGKIVAVPEPLKIYRHHDNCFHKQEAKMRGISGWDHRMNRLNIRKNLLKSIIYANLSFQEKLNLVTSVFSSWIKSKLDKIKI